MRDDLVVSIWNGPTTLDTFKTVNLVDNDHIKHQEKKAYDLFIKDLWNNKNTLL